MLTLRARQETLQRVVSAISHETGIGLVLSEELRVRPLTIERTSIRLENALTALLDESGAVGYRWVFYADGAVPGGGTWATVRAITGVSGGLGASVGLADQSAEVAPGEVLVKFAAGLSAAAIATEVARLGVDVLRALPQVGLYRLKLPAGLSVDAFLRAQRGNPAFQRVEANPIARSQGQSGPLQPNDPFWAQQWALVRIGAPAAWAVTTGRPEVVIAIIDTGVDLHHPDLDTQLVQGRNVLVPNSSPQDDHGHGTAMAGIIGAAMNNGIGIAGVCPGCRIMPIKALDVNGVGTYADVIEGMIYAADHGARVLNLSVGGSVYSLALNEAVDYARSLGSVVVAAAGNSGSGALMYPAACPGVLAVTATEQDDTIWAQSNIGQHVALAAPGAGITTTGLDVSYINVTGTSASTAHVAGVAALVASNHPDFRGTQIEQALQQTAIDLGAPGRDPVFGNGLVNASASSAATLQKAHDLAVVGLRIEPTKFAPGESVRVIVTVENQGAFVETDVNVRVTGNAGLLSESRTLPTLGPGERADVQVNWVAEGRGAGEIVVIGSVSPVAGETEFTNNERQVRSIYDATANVYQLYANNPFVHSWVAYRAFELLKASSPSNGIVSEINATPSLLWGSGGSGNSCVLFGISITNAWCSGHTNGWYDSYSPISGWNSSAETGNSILEGSWEEDEDWFGGLPGYFRHFWNPDGGYSDGYLEFESNLERARTWWEQAKIAYVEQPNNRGLAYYYLGRVVHLLGDLGVPDHTHNDPHPGPEDWYSPSPNNLSNYEGYTSGYYRVYLGSGSPKDLNNLPLALPDNYLGTSAIDPRLGRLFYNMAQFTQHYDSSDVNGDSIGAAAMGKLPELGTKNKQYPALMDLNHRVDYGTTPTVRWCDYFFGCSYVVIPECNGSNDSECFDISRYYGKIYIPQAFWDRMSLLDQLEVTYSYKNVQQAPQSTTDFTTFTAPYYVVPDRFLGGQYGTGGQTNDIFPENIRYVAALYQLFWEETHPTTTCTGFTINPTSATPSFGANSTSVTITGSPAGCTGGNWTTAGNGSWLTVSSASGTGSSSATVSWTQNPSTTLRSSSATIAGNSFNVNQSGTGTPTCTSFSASPTSTSPSSAAGGTGVTVTGSPAGCTGGSWTASGNGSWITVSPTSGSGSGGVTVSWQQNPSTSSRSGSATIANNNVAVNQSGTGTTTAELVTNGTFASSTTGWTSTPYFYFNSVYSTCRPGSCPGYAYLAYGGLPGDHLTGHLSQTVTIPSNATSASLSFWTFIETTETTSTTEFDVLKLYIEGTNGALYGTAANLSNLNKSTGYVQRTFNLLSVANPGQTVVLHFFAQTDGSTTGGTGAKPTIFRIDDVSILATTATLPPTCTSFSINPSSAAPTSDAGSTGVTVTGSPAGCTGGSWSASGNGSWITVSPASGSGSGATTVSWAQNTSTLSRSGGASIANNGFAVTQDGAAAQTCTSFSISPTSANPGTAAGSQNVTITGAPSGCTGGSWTTNGNGSWLTVSPASGSGSGSATVSWSQNGATSSRSDNVTIANNGFAVLQAGTAAQTCTSFSISPTTANPGAATGSQNVSITGAPSGCTGGNWAASGNGSWLTLSPASGSGSGSTTVSWTQNPGTSSRLGTATIANSAFAVTQAAPGTLWSPSLSSPVQVAADGGQQPRIRKFGSNVYIVNGDNTAGRNLMFYKSTNNGATFTSTSLASPVMNSFEYDFGMDASGNLFVFWENQNDDQLRIRTSLDAGVTWSTPSVVASGFSWMDQPSSYFANGAVYLLFRGYKNQQIDLYFTKSTNNGVSFSTPVAVTSSSIQEDSGKIAVFGNNVYAIYYDNYSLTPGNTYLVASSNGGASFGGSVRVNSVSGKSDFGPALAVDGSGAVFIAYSDKTFDGEGDLYVAKTTNGGGSFSYVLAADSTYRGQAYPRMVVDTNNVIHLVWNDNRDNVSYGSVYYTRSIDGGASYAPNVNLRTSGGISNAAVDADAGVAYLAVTDYKTSPFSTRFLSVTWLPSAPTVMLPGAPTGVSVTAGNGQVAVNWVAPVSNGGAMITNYTVTANPGGATCTWTGGAITCTVTGLANGTAYTFVVAATNSAGTGVPSSPSAAATPRTVPSWPTDLTAVAENGRARLTWLAPGNTGGAAITGYTVKRGTSSGGESTLASGVASASYTDATIVTGVAYYYVVRAENVAGESGSSGEVVFLSFTDDPLQPGVTGAKAAHLTELRGFVDALRARYRLAAFNWTDPAITPNGTPIKAVHLMELRSALDGVYSAARRAPPVYSASLTGAAVSAASIAEIRAAIRAIF